MQQNNLMNFIEKAYKKLKSYSYYDNKNMFLKGRVVEFENYEVNNYEYEKNLNEKLEKINQFLQVGEKITIKEEKVEKYLEMGTFIIRGVPKSIKEEFSDGKTIKNFEISNINAEVNKLMHYIDLDIYSQIIGTLWVMLIGKELEKKYIKYTAGNLLEKDLDGNNLKLFKPYYVSYERWRDDGIEIIEDRMNKGHRSTMITLDIKEYYYSLNLNIEREKKDILENFKQKKNKSGITDEVFVRINDYIFDIIRAYSQSMNLKKLSNDNEVRNILPIGFLPSSILSNWYLNRFDKIVNEKLNPIYYKRYVDDILIILNTDYKEEKEFKNSELVNSKFYDTGIFNIGVLVKSKNSIKISAEILSIEDKKEFKGFIEKIDEEEFSLKKEILKGILDKKELDKEDYKIIYEWNKKIGALIEELNEEKFRRIIKELKEKSGQFKKIYFLKEYYEKEQAYLIIQDEKVKIYDFLSTGSRALINNFKKELGKNASVFKFLPQRDEVLNNFDKEVYKIEYSDSIFKLSSIENLKINKYNLSKFLARVIYSDKLENSDYVEEVNKKVEWIFKGKYAVEYFFLWDKIFNYYLVNRKYIEIKRLFINIFSSIEKLNIEISEFACNNRGEEVESLKRDLKRYLELALARNYALDDGLFWNVIKENGSQSNEDNIKIDKDLKKISKEIGADKNIKLILDIYKYREYIRISNMLNQSLIRSTLMNYYYLGYKKCYANDRIFKVNFISSDVGKPEDLTVRNRCFKVNSNYNISSSIDENSSEFYERCKLNSSKESKCSKCSENLDQENNEIKCVDIDPFVKKYNPRFVHFHECILDAINTLILKGEIIQKGEEIIRARETFYELNNLQSETNKNLFIKFYKDINDQKTQEQLNDTHFKYFNSKDYLFSIRERRINYLESYNLNEKRKKTLKIGVANMEVYDNEIVKSFKKLSTVSSERFTRISELLNMAVKDGAEMIVFPEVSIPLGLLGIMADFSRRHDVVIICGLEHIIYNNKTCCNYIATILPDKYKDYTYATIKLKLKNHYSPKEKEWVRGYGWKLPEEEKNNWIKEYDLIRWKGIDFSSFSCFELANIRDRALFTSFVDLLIGSVHNKDINYYSNIIESLARDVHCYVIHVNDSNLGDNRIISPARTIEKNILQISGGLNNTVLIGEIDIQKLREFQIKSHNLQIEEKTFKPVPPEFKHNNVKIRDGLHL